MDAVAEVAGLDAARTGLAVAVADGRVLVVEAKLASVAVAAAVTVMTEVTVTGGTAEQSLSSPESVAVAVEAALDTASDALALELELEELELEPLEPTFDKPGSCVMLTSCCPSGTGPLGFAGQLPGGLRGLLWPKGMVPAWPTAMPLTKVDSSALANWHWKSPLSSWLAGADWQ